MDHTQFQDWLSDIDGLSSQQKSAAKSVLSGETEAIASLAAIEARLAETRQCPHCGTPGAVSKGMARGLRRYQCKACKKTFNAATGTAIQGLHNKGRCLTFGECLTDGLTVRESAERCNFAVSTAFRWRHRFLGTQDQNPPNLTGIVEVTKPMFWKAERETATLTERRAAGAARPASLACQTSWFRY